MLPPQHRVFLWTAPLVVIGWCLVAQPQGWGTAFLLISYGTLFGQTTVAAAWCALGPGRLLVRLPISFLWVVTLAAAGMFSMTILGPGTERGGMIGCCLMGQWLLVQLPLWVLVAVCGLRLRHANLDSDPRDWQFGIRQLMTVTALVAVLLGIGRWVVSAFEDRLAGATDDWPIFSFLVVAAAVVSLPPLLAVLLPRYAIWATMGSLVVVALATASEHLVWRWLRLPALPPAQTFFIILNLVTVAWALAFGVVVRRSGYLLGTARRA